jgi:hypothetical protein
LSHSLTIYRHRSRRPKLNMRAAVETPCQATMHNSNHNSPSSLRGWLFCKHPTQSQLVQRKIRLKSLFRNQALRVRSKADPLLAWPSQLFLSLKIPL